jgi:hypothetical protein
MHIDIPAGLGAAAHVKLPIKSTPDWGPLGSFARLTPRTGRWRAVNWSTRSGTGGATAGRPTSLPTQRGGNCEPGAGGSRLAVGGLSPDQPMTAQLMSTPSDPYG